MKNLFPRIVAGTLWCTAIFPFIRWWCRRLAEPFETSQWATLALGLLLAFTWWKSTHRTASLPPWKLYLAAGGVLSFGILYAFLPLTLAVCPALLAGLPLLLPEDSPQGPLPLSLAVLAFLILPSAMILELFLGVPLRALAVSGAALLLRLGGFEIVQRGFELTVNGQAIWVDAPCAGVRMLSTGAALACICAYLFHLNSRRTLALGGLSLFLILVCNCARVTILTACEALGCHLDPSTHSLIGLAALAPGIITIALAALTLERFPLKFKKQTTKTQILYTSPHPHSPLHGLINLSLATTCCIILRGSVPASSGSVPIRPGSVPTRTGPVPTSQGSVPIGSGSVPTHSGSVPIGSGSVPTSSGSVPASTGSVPIRPGSVPASSGSVPTSQGSVPMTKGFPGWPLEFEGQSLVETPLEGHELSFSNDFPGRIGRFTAGQHIVILRWTDRPTHRVHSASACLAATGWQVTPLPLLRQSDGDWSAFSAERDGITLTIREQIRSADGQTISDVSTWFIRALFGKTQGPWWIITVATPNQERPAPRQ